MYGIPGIRTGTGNGLLRRGGIIIFPATSEANTLCQRALVTVRRFQQPACLPGNSASSYGRQTDRSAGKTDHEISDNARRGCQGPGQSGGSVKHWGLHGPFAHELRGLRPSHFLLAGRGNRGARRADAVGLVIPGRRCNALQVHFDTVGGADTTKYLPTT